MGIKWRDSLAIGVEQIDEQHRELLQHFDRLLTACEEGKGMEELKKLLNFLDIYVQIHFNDEEALQLLWRYPGYEAHRKEHASFMERIKDLQLEIDREGVALYHVIETNNLLFKWLINHISKVDRDLGRFLKTSRTKVT
jgi:hemerythrin